MNTASPCYKFSRSVVGEHVPLDNLRLELSSTRFYFLSYHHLDMAIFESATDRDTLTISFLNHQVRIAGTNLRELAVAINVAPNIKEVIFGCRSEPVGLHLPPC
jgi:hypothetical protein